MWPYRWRLHNRKRLSFSVIAENLTRRLQGGGDSSFHTRQIDVVLYEVASEIEIFDPGIWPRTIGPGSNGVNKEGHLNIGIQLTVLYIIRRNWKVFSDLFQQHVFRAFLTYFIQWSKVARDE